MANLFMGNSKLRILITTGLSAGDIGGPFQYAHNLEKEFKSLGHEAKIISYGTREKSLPPWIRHFYFLLRVFAGAMRADKILTLDTYSVGVPSVLAAKIFRKKIIARVGGDFLWSAYVNRTSKSVTLPAFYKSRPKLNAKEKLISFFMKKMLKMTDFLAFNTEWQRNIWRSFYRIDDGKSGVVRNFIPEKREGKTSSAKNFIWAGRLIPEKNPKMLEKFAIDIITGESHEKVLEKVKNSHAAVSLALTDICPNFIIEAISFGKPFIMTRETGLNELFPKGGIFVDPLDEKDIEQAIEAMLEDTTYTKLVEELKSINISHSWEKIACEFLDIWKNL